MNGLMGIICGKGLHGAGDVVSVASAAVPTIWETVVPKVILGCSAVSAVWGLESKSVEAHRAWKSGRQPLKRRRGRRRRSRR
jgi:hypothetical protein